MHKRYYQVAIFVNAGDPRHPDCQMVHFAAEHSCPIVLSRYLQHHMIPGGRVVWHRWP